MAGTADPYRDVSENDDGESPSGGEPTSDRGADADARGPTGSPTGGGSSGGAGVGAGSDGTAAGAGGAAGDGVPAPDPDPDRDADLAPRTGGARFGHLARAVVHLVYWPAYLLVFPLHGLARVLWRYRTPGGRLRAVGRALGHLRFALPRERLTLYLRASWVPTPGTLLGRMPGAAPAPTDPTTARTEGVPERTRTAVLRRDDYVCQNCGAGGGPHGETELHVDHAVPKSRGGADAPRNLRTLCRGCHQARHARTF